MRRDAPRGRRSIYAPLKKPSQAPDAPPYNLQPPQKREQYNCPPQRKPTRYIHAASTTGNQANDSTVEHITRFATCSGERLARTAIR